MSRSPEPRIRDASTHHRRYCSLTTTADYLCVGWRTVAALIDEGHLEAVTIGKQRKVVVSSIATYEASIRRTA